MYVSCRFECRLRRGTYSRPRVARPPSSSTYITYIPTAGRHACRHVRAIVGRKPWCHVFLTDTRHHAITQKVTVHESQFKPAALLRLYLQIETHRVASAAKRLRGSMLRRYIHPGIARFATKLAKKFFECGHDRLEVLLSEVGPRVVVEGLVNCPLLDVHCPSRGGKRIFPLRRCLLLNIVPP